MKTPAVVGLLLLLAACPGPAHGGRPGVVGGQYRYWAFSDDNDLRNPLVYWAPGPFHLQMDVWDFVSPDTKDQFRPEIGIHLRDRRRSVYTVQWRSERRQERFWLMTDQVLGDHLVGRLEVSPIVSPDSTVWVLAAGADYYWGSWNFLSATVIRDPRGERDDLWVFPMRLRLANESNNWVQATFAPASRRTVGWALDAKVAWVRAGVERNNRYDFTRIDNTIVTLGVEFALPAASR